MKHTKRALPQYAKTITKNQDDEEIKAAILSMVVSLTNKHYGRNVTRRYANEIKIDIAMPFYRRERLFLCL